MNCIRTGAITAALLAAGLASSGAAAANLVVNGGFEQWGYQGGTESAGLGANAPGNGLLTGWTASGLNILFVPGDPRANNGGAAVNFRIWGNEGGAGDVANGFSLSPSGGNYIAADADPNLGGPIRQTVTGFRPGKSYRVSFEWAAGQQRGFNGPTQEQWFVSLKDNANATIGSYATARLNNPNHGFQPWRTETFAFTATQTSHLLTFLADGAPAGVPPFSLLDNVSIVVGGVPEPSTWVQLIAGFGLMGAAARLRRQAPRNA
ncbi:hypothetical protein IP88_10420 [alpha proteobacterium AAP81b]|nr:hypothetical protein IP88_10420 [alpha proteobacterium AAP81b]